MTPQMTPQAWQLQLAFGLCRAGRLLVLVSLVLTGFALAGPGVSDRVLAGLSAVLLLPVLYLGLRLEIDRGLFQRLAAHRDGDGQALASLDTALAELGWKPSAQSLHPLAARVAGVARLVKGAGVLVALQVILLVLAR